MSALMKSPTLTPAIVTVEKSGWPPIFPMNPMTMLVNDVITAANARPMMNATASSTRLPRRMNALNPVMLDSPLGRLKTRLTLAGEQHGHDRRDRRLGQCQGPVPGDRHDDQCARAERPVLAAGPG